MSGTFAIPSLSTNEVEFNKNLLNYDSNNFDNLSELSQIITSNSSNELNNIFKNSYNNLFELNEVQCYNNEQTSITSSAECFKNNLNLPNNSTNCFYNYENKNLTVFQCNNQIEEFNSDKIYLSKAEDTKLINSKILNERNIEKIQNFSSFSNLNEWNEQIDGYRNLIFKHLIEDIKNTCLKLNLSADPNQWNFNDCFKWIKEMCEQFQLKVPSKIAYHNRLYANVECGGGGRALLEMNIEEFCNCVGNESGSTLYAQLQLWKTILAMESYKKRLSKTENLCCDSNNIFFDETSLNYSNNFYNFNQNNSIKNITNLSEPLVSTVYSAKSLKVTTQNPNKSTDYFITSSYNELELKDEEFAHKVQHTPSSSYFLINYNINESIKNNSQPLTCFNFNSNYSKPINTNNYPNFYQKKYYNCNDYCNNESFFAYNQLEYCNNNNFYDTSTNNNSNNLNITNSPVNWCATNNLPIGLYNNSNPTGTIHLWHFIRELLDQPKEYGSCVRWVNKQEGTFKIESSHHLARFWGMRKNRLQMNYDKLSRSLRQYYKKGIIQKPEKKQRLVYKFLPPYNL